MPRREPPDDVQLWLMTLPASGGLLGDAGAVLDVEERRRASRFHHAVDRDRYVLAHAGLRTLLGAALGGHPAEVRIARAACPLCGEGHGRPVLADGGDLEFSMAHTTGAVAYAIGRTPVGVDIEATERPVDPDDLDRALHPAERHALRSLPGGDRPRAALRCWVRKEAYLKGLGTGLGIDPAGVDVGLGGEPTRDHPTPFGPGPAGWHLADVPGGAHHLVAVAVADPPGGAAPPPLAVHAIEAETLLVRT